MFRIERGPLLVQTLAVCLAARAFAETEFVTDKLGAAMAARLGWSFGQVSTPLEAWPTDGLTHIWALGKLVACTLQERRRIADSFFVMTHCHWRGRVTA